MPEPVADPNVHSSTEDASVDVCLNRVDRILREQTTAYLDRVRTEVLDPLSEVVEDARDAHQDVRRTLGVETADDRSALYAAVRRYRRETMASVWRPLRDRLDRLKLGRQLREARTTLRSARANITSEVPGTVQRPEPEDLYVPSPSDGWTWRLVGW